MQRDPWDERRAEQGGSTTIQVTHPNLNTAAGFLFRIHAELQQFPKTTWRQPRMQHHLRKFVRLFCSLAMSMPEVVLQFLDVSRAPPHCKVLRDNVYMGAPKERGVDHYSACDSRDGLGHVTQDTTVVVLCARRPLRGSWEQKWTLSGTGSKSADEIPWILGTCTTPQA